MTASSIVITESALLTIAPGAAPEIIKGIVQYQGLLAKYGIVRPKDVQHFLAQSAAETVGFTRLEENLYYTTAKRVMAVWPSRFPTVASAQPYLRNPERLANKVYGGRLGNSKAGDGWKFRGSGLKQTTGYTNYHAVEVSTGLPVTDQPEMLRRFSEALESACIYWRDNNLVRFARADDITGLTRAIQGGSGGLADRRIYTERAGRVDWTSSGTPKPQPATTSDPVLRQGARNQSVRTVQLLLERHGFEIVIDGIFGGGTDNLVREFQEDKRLMADGVVGPATWAALRADPTPKAPAEEPEAEKPNTLIAALIALFSAIFGKRS